MNLNSIQVVYVEERVATSTSSDSRITEPEISHLPQAGRDPELFKQKQHSAPNAGPKLSVAPRTPPASDSNALLAVPNSSLPTTSLPTETTALTVTVPDCGGPLEREAEAIIFDKWPQPAEFRSWTMSFKSEVYRSSQYPRAGMQWIGEVEDAASIDDLFCSASRTEDQYRTSRILISRWQADSGRS